MMNVTKDNKSKKILIVDGLEYCKKCKLYHEVFTGCPLDIIGTK